MSKAVSRKGTSNRAPLNVASRLASANCFAEPLRGEILAGDERGRLPVPVEAHRRHPIAVFVEAGRPRCRKAGLPAEVLVEPPALPAGEGAVEVSGVAVVEVRQRLGDERPIRSAVVEPTPATSTAGSNDSHVVTPSRQIRRSVVLADPSTGMKLFSMRIPDRGDARAKPDGRRRRRPAANSARAAFKYHWPQPTVSMCGRYTLFTPATDLEARFDADFAGVEPRYNCAPGQDLPVIADEDPTVATRMEWGLTPRGPTSRST